MKLKITILILLMTALSVSADGGEEQDYKLEEKPQLTARQQRLQDQPHSDNYFFLNQPPPFGENKLPDPLLGQGYLHKLLDCWYDAENRMKKQGLDWNIYYTVWYQQAQHTRKDPKFHRPDYMFNGRLDLGTRWDLPEGFWGKAHVEALMRQGTNYGWAFETQLNNNVGSAAGINGGYSPPVSLNILSWTQHLFDENLLVTVGKLHPNQYLTLSSVANDESLQFTASAFDGNNMPFLGTYAPGLVIQATPFENKDIYIHALGLDTADDPSQGLGNMDKGRYAGSIEIGWTPKFNGMKGHYKLNAWYANMKSQHLSSGSGFVIYADQEIVKNTVLFVQYGLGEKKVTHANNFLSGGIGIYNPFGRAGEMFGAAICWARGSNNGRNEKLIETFYRIQLTECIQFTPDLQILLDPVNDPSHNSNIIVGARVRVQF